MSLAEKAHRPEQSLDEAVAPPAALLAADPAVANDDRSSRLFGGKGGGQAGGDKANQSTTETLAGTGGNAGSVVDDFTNMDASRFDPRDKEADWILAKLAKAQKDKKPTTILAPKKDGASKDKKEMSDKIPGLHFWHFYPIIEVDEKAKRVKLFNPWGHDHPNGDGWVDIEVIRTFFIEVDING